MVTRGLLSSDAAQRLYAPVEREGDIIRIRTVTGTSWAGIDGGGGGSFVTGEIVGAAGGLQSGGGGSGFAHTGFTGGGMVSGGNGSGGGQAFIPRAAIERQMAEEDKADTRVFKRRHELTDHIVKAFPPDLENTVRDLLDGVGAQLVNMLAVKIGDRFMKVEEVKPRVLGGRRIMDIE